jgi:hypothetical protein
MSTKQPPPIGPSVGGLVAGLAWGRVRGTEGSAVTVAGELAATRERLLRASASAEAQQALANAIVDELADLEAGRISAAERRLSDPKNRAARVAHVVKVEDKALQRLGGGKPRRRP